MNLEHGCALVVSPTQCSDACFLYGTGKTCETCEPEGAPMTDKLPPAGWLVHSGRTFVNKTFISEDQAQRSVEDRKDGAHLEPMVKLSDALAVRLEREALPSQQELLTLADALGLYANGDKYQRAVELAEAVIRGFAAIRARSEVIDDSASPIN